MLNLWYAYLVEHVESREAFDAHLWSDPAREQNLLRLLA